MANTKITAELRKKPGKSEAIKLRSEGLIPAVVYGHNKETKAIALKEKEIVKIVTEISKTSVLRLNVEDNITPVILKEVQRDPVTGKMIHVDFQMLSDNEKIKINIPIKFDNTEALEKTTAVLSHPLTELAIQCYPKDIPKHSVHIDVMKIKLGHAIHVQDLEIASNSAIEILEEKTAIVASISDVKELKVELVE